MGNIIIEKKMIEVAKTLNKNKKIMLLSDINQGNRIVSYNNLLQKIKDSDPNYIIILGNLINKKGFDLNLVKKLIIDLANITETFICPGKNEKEFLEKSRLLSWFYELNYFDNVYTLDNEIFVCGDVCFTSFSPSYESYSIKDPSKRSEIILKDYKKAYFDKEKNDNYFEILLTPSSSIFCSLDIKNLFSNRYDFIFSGYNKAFPLIEDYPNIYINKEFRKFKNEGIGYNFLEKFNDYHISEITLTKTYN